MPVEHAHPSGVKRPRYAGPAQERGPGAPGVGLHFTKDVVQAVEKLHLLLHRYLGDLLKGLRRVRRPGARGRDSSS